MNDDPRIPTDCEQCAKWADAGHRGWTGEYCKPRCFRQQFEGFPARMAELWVLVARGEIVDDKGTTNWTIDWSAFQALVMVQHDSVTRDPADEIVEALLAIRAELMRPATDRLAEHPLD